MLKALGFNRLKVQPFQQAVCFKLTQLAPLHTGLSIIPAELTLGDCITRCVAAVYLRQRSRSFREWVESIEGVHLLTWVLRATLLAAACYTAAHKGMDGASIGLIIAGAAAIAAVLRVAEMSADGGSSSSSTARPVGEKGAVNMAPMSGDSISAKGEASSMQKVSPLWLVESVIAWCFASVAKGEHQS